METRNLGEIDYSPIERQRAGTAVSGNFPADVRVKLQAFKSGHLPGKNRAILQANLHLPALRNSQLAVQKAAIDYQVQHAIRLHIEQLPFAVTG